MVSGHLKGKIDQVIAHGLDNLGMYHSKRPLIRNKSGQLVSEDLNCLFYYHNRLVGYGLEKSNG